MMLACPGCRTVYDVAPARFGSRPRLVRCSACGTKWSYLPNSAQPGTLASDAPIGEAAAASEPAGDAEVAGSTVDTREPATTASIDREEDTPTEPAAEPPADEPDDASPTSPPATASPEAELPRVPADQPDAAPATSEKRGRSLWQRIQLRPGLAAAFSATATVVGVLSLLIVLRGAVVAAFPFSAGFYGLLGLLPYGPGAGLRIQDIASARQRRDGTDVLTVTGVVSNVADEPALLPTIWITVLDAEENELQSVSLDNDGASLAAGEKLAFDKDIPNPGPRARRVRVGFMTTPELAPE